MFYSLLSRAMANNCTFVLRLLNAVSTFSCLSLAVVDWLENVSLLCVKSSIRGLQCLVVMKA